MSPSVVVLIIFLVLTTISLLIFTLNSRAEKENRAFKIGIGSLIIIGFFLTFFIINRKSEKIFLVIISSVLDTGFVLILLGLVIPYGRNQAAAKGTAGYVVDLVERYDERDHMFARIRSLRKGIEYEKYYRNHPELKEGDDYRRSLGGPLGRPGSIDQDSRTNLAMIHALYSFPALIGRDEIVTPKPDPAPLRIEPEQLTSRVKGLARHLGAGLVGITKLNPLWIYSHQGEIFYGNWEDWGKENPLEHSYAIVMATEMDRNMIMSGPHTPATIESTLHYSQGAVISVQLAHFLADLGYQATAHHFRHYDVNLVPLAVDAGLGELGRNGYLITKEFGPRVRLVAVTTNAELIPDQPVDLGVQHFCQYCKKCAHLCPSRSIPSGEKVKVNGTLRWKLNAETCSEFWAKVGTDCGICMAVCPWSHPKTLSHKFSTWLVTRSAFARQLLIRLDDLFYGNYKHNRYHEDWCDYEKANES